MHHLKTAEFQKIDLADVFKTPLLPKLESFRENHKVHFYLFLA